MKVSKIFACSLLALAAAPALAITNTINILPAGFTVSSISFSNIANLANVSAPTVASPPANITYSYTTAPTGSFTVTVSMLAPLGGCNVQVNSNGTISTATPFGQVNKCLGQNSTTLTVVFPSPAKK